MDITDDQLTNPYWSRGVVLMCALTICIILRLIFAKKQNTSSSSIAIKSNELVNSSYSSSSPGWDVFLSFYGKDTRRNFVANLYYALDQAGILTFRDDPALLKGEEITSGLLNAIENSKLFVVVISENYACSAWCLNELVEILRCKRTENQVIPVFYYVDPSDLRYQRGSRKALERLKKRHSLDVIEKWKSALEEIAVLSGYHFKKDADENEADTIQEILENVAQAAPTKVLHLEEYYLCGIDSVVEEIYEKLSLESNDIRAIGICGMAGIGKTTTAKAFYSKYSNKFDISCLIENVERTSESGSPLLSLLRQLLMELLRRKNNKARDVESGMRELKRVLCSKKALIVLDALDQSNHLESLGRICNMFSNGSRIIITTRDVNFVNQSRVYISKVDIYMLKELGQKDSLELFSYYAFRKTIPPDNFRELSVKFVKSAGGLPLALKVLGSSLRGRTQASFWKDQLEKVKANPEIHEILKLGYEGLSHKTEKEIFLDIVFFFLGEDKDEAIHVFESCDFYPKSGLRILVERNLLTIDKNNKFQMHSLIQDMGREVMREVSENGKCKRLYLCEENARSVLQNLEGTDSIEGLILNLTMLTERHFNARVFERLPNLRLLEIIGAHDIKGKFENSFHELRCIRWSNCPWKRVPISLRPQKLVSLTMPFSKLRTLPTGVTNLKTVDVSYSMNLQTVNDFTELKMIEKLLLRGCESLFEVHSSIGQLTNLAHLDLGECRQLRGLSDHVGQLAKLGHLDLHDCRSLKRLPEPIKQLTNLSCLDVGGCRNLKKLPEQLGDMKGLKMLDVSDTAIEELPDSITHLKQMIQLRLVWCVNLRKLPEQFGDMEGLRTFDAKSSALEQLPDSSGRLINLVELNLTSFKNLASLPNSMCKLKLLKTLNLRCCSNLEKLPDQLGELQSLEECDIGGTAIEELPDSIGLLSRLQVLEMGGWRKLKYMPNSMRNLQSLTSITGMQWDDVNIIFADMLKLMKLEYLEVHCNIRLSLPKILEFSSLVALTLYDEGQIFSSTKRLSLTKLVNLKHLVLHDCKSLGSFFPEVPLNLENLEVNDYATLEQLPDLSILKELKILKLWRCDTLQSLPPLPPQLQELTALECTGLQDIPDLSMLKKLKSLSLVQCSNLKPVSLKQSSLQVGKSSSFTADLPNTEIAEWFSYKSSENTISFDIPPNLGDNFLGLAFWLVYTCKTVEILSYIRVEITNKTEGVKRNYDSRVCTDTVGEAHSRVECIGTNGISEKFLDVRINAQSRIHDIRMENNLLDREGGIWMKSGDRITVTFRRLLNCYNGLGEEFQCGEVKVEMCGAHVIQKTPSILV